MVVPILLCCKKTDYTVHVVENNINLHIIVFTHAINIGKDRIIY